MAIVRHDDATDLKNTEPDCYVSKVDGGGLVTTAAAITLELRLDFQSTGDEIMLGAIGVKIQSMTECVDTIAKLKELIPVPGMNPCVMVNGYHESGDGGGGSFLWDSVFNVDLTKFPEGEDLGIIIKPDSFSATNPGRWKRQFTGPVDIRWFGASTSSDDNTDAIQRAIDTGYPVYIPYSGSKNPAFKFARRLKLWPGTVIRGDGRMTSILEFTGCGIAIDDVDYGPATRSILYGFKLQASGDRSIDYRHPNDQRKGRCARKLMD